MNYKIHDIKNPISEKGFEKIYSLLSSAFPQQEMRTKENQRKLLSDKRYKLLVADEKDEIIGFMAIWDLEKYNFIEHFAMDNRLRGKGLGGKLLDCFLEISDKPVILEVELPDVSPEATRRIEFYKRHGFLFNDYQYHQPPLQESFPPIALRIMSYPAALDESDFISARNILYTHVYGFFEKRLDKMQK